MSVLVASCDPKRDWVECLWCKNGSSLILRFGPPANLGFLTEKSTGFRSWLSFFSNVDARQSYGLLDDLRLPLDIIQVKEGVWHGSFLLQFAWVLGFMWWYFDWIATWWLSLIFFLYFWRKIYFEWLWCKWRFGFSYVFLVFCLGFLSYSQKMLIFINFCVLPLIWTIMTGQCSECILDAL